MTRARSIADRMAEAMRRGSVGLRPPLWFDLSDIGKEDWRKRADHVIKIAGTLGLRIALKEDPDNGQPPPPIR